MRLLKLRGTRVPPRRNRLYSEESLFENPRSNDRYICIARRSSISPELLVRASYIARTSFLRHSRHTDTLAPRRARWPVILFQTRREIQSEARPSIGDRGKARGRIAGSSWSASRARGAPLTGAIEACLSPIRRRRCFACALTVTTKRGSRACVTR